jgi:ribulose-phosphate 3-epimerase
LVRQTETFTDYAQLDFMDGRFVPSRSFSVDDVVALKPAISWEAHLMILQAEEYLERLKQAGAAKIVFHYEAVASPEKMIFLVKGMNMKVGMAINPETGIEAIKKLVPELDSVLFMAVNPGYYGAKFIPEVLDKIKEFRRTFFKTEVGIDGGMKESNIVEVVRSGVDVVFVGSAIFLQQDPAASYQKLAALAQSAV